MINFHPYTYVYIFASDYIIIKKIITKQKVNQKEQFNLILLAKFYSLFIVIFRAILCVVGTFVNRQFRNIIYKILVCKSIICGRGDKAYSRTSRVLSRKRSNYFN